MKERKGPAVNLVFDSGRGVMIFFFFGLGAYREDTCT
jgi:hypothetical protein